VRASAGTPKHVNILGFFYDIDTGKLTEVVRDEAKVAGPA
jgi:carbonic anhydrase